MTDEDVTQAPAAPGKTVTVAILDASRVFVGTTEMLEREVTGAHVVLPNGCDLEPGKYRHDDARGAFVPVGDAPAPEENLEALRAVALGFIALHDQGLTLPEETVKWLGWFVTTVDFQGVMDEKTNQMVQRYIKRKGG